MSNIPKNTAESTHFVNVNRAGVKMQVPIPSGTKIGLAVAALHHNREEYLIRFLRRAIKSIARYWDNPTHFEPTWFLGDWPKDAFLSFSGGVRSCLGRRCEAYKHLTRHLLTIVSPLDSQS